jgi:hypothetical protein
VVEVGEVPDRLFEVAGSVLWEAGEVVDEDAVVDELPDIPVLVAT